MTNTQIFTVDAWDALDYSSDYSKQRRKEIADTEAFLQRATHAAEPIEGSAKTFGNSKRVISDVKEWISQHDANIPSQRIGNAAVLFADEATALMFALVFGEYFRVCEFKTGDAE